MVGLCQEALDIALLRNDGMNSTTRIRDLGLGGHRVLSMADIAISCTYLQSKICLAPDRHKHEDGSVHLLTLPPSSLFPRSVAIVFAY